MNMERSMLTGPALPANDNDNPGISSFRRLRHLADDP
jgi:hypothetical protein